MADEENGEDLQHESEENERPRSALVEKLRGDALKRENTYLLRIIGGLGSLILIVAGGFFTFWIHTVSTGLDDNKRELTHVWELMGQRGDRVLNLESQMKTNNTTTAELYTEVKTLSRDMDRVKNRLKIIDGAQ